MDEPFTGCRGDKNVNQELRTCPGMGGGGCTPARIREGVSNPKIPGRGRSKLPLLFLSVSVSQFAKLQNRISNPREGLSSKEKPEKNSVGHFFLSLKAAWLDSMLDSDNSH